MGDALYKSNYSPWSRYLTGELGNDPGYDPLEYAIEEAHKRGIELQAWFNPFRIDSNSQNFDLTDYISKLPEESPLKKNLNWIVKYDKYTYLDIGIPEVREYVINLIIEVVDKYNIDGIILDDYFYPYPVEGVEFSDKSTYEKYGQEFNSKEDWRRNNVDNFIYELNKKIKEKNKNKYIELVSKLDTLSPLKTLTRGYSIIEKDGKIVKSITDLQAEDEISIRMKDGEKQAKII